MEKFQKVGIIPARFASTRFPGKPLAVIGGKPMIQRVYEQAKKSKLDLVIVATDHQGIADTVKAFGGQAQMTHPDLPSGTDRCREAMSQLGYTPEMVVNIQGDEPFIDPEQINQIISLLERPEVEIATLISPAESKEEIENTNRVKVVVSESGKALYFSRLPIPFQREVIENPSYPHYIHLGIYGFRGETLNAIANLKQTHLEQCESLEQLRWLANDFSIYTDVTSIRSEAVDTPEDLMFIEKKYFL